MKGGLGSFGAWMLPSPSRPPALPFDLARHVVSCSARIWVLRLISHAELVSNVVHMPVCCPVRSAHLTGQPE